MMPEMTGMDFYEALRETCPAELERVVFLTGGAVTDRARAFLDRMAGRAVDKPLDPPALRALVRRWLDAAGPGGPS
jgi:CheY-like chemotaxis protein